MKNKNFIIAAIILTLILAGVAFFFILFAGKNNQEQRPAQQNPFPDAAERENAPVVEDSGATNVVERFYIAGEGGADEHVPALRALTNQPTGGDVVFVTKETTNKTKGSYVRYLDRETGNIFDTPIDRIGQQNIVYDGTIFGVGNVLWAREGNAVVLQRTAQNSPVLYTYVTSITPNPSADTFTMRGKNLEENLISVSLDPNAGRVFYLSSDEEGGSIGYIENITDTTRKQVWTSPLKGLISSWNADNTILIYTKPTRLGESVVWKLDPDTQKVSVLLSGKKELTAKTNANGTKVLYTFFETTSGARVVRVLDTETGNVTEVPFSTISEKCAWSTVDTDVLYCAIPGNISTKNYLEQWYFGTLLSQDVLWKINTRTKETVMLFDPQEETSTTFDITHVTVGPGDKFVVFTDKKNGALWSLQVPEKHRPKGNENKNTP